MKLTAKYPLLGALLAPFIFTACATAHEGPPPETEDSVHAYILLDRTGSMQSIWDEALGSVNAYAGGLSDAENDGPDLDPKISLAVFDAQDGLQFDVLRGGVEASDWNELTNDEASPRGMTPLFDAIGRIVSLAEQDAPEKAVLVIMTDGQENASREMDKAAAKAALDRARAREWEVVFLGAEFANFDDADAVGVSGAKSMAVSRDKMGETMERLSKKTRDYATGAEQSVVFDEEDRAIAEEDEVKQRTGQ
ncbi:MAG: VWA domain-containing protein [Pseudomonadota bacterium]